MTDTPRRMTGERRIRIEAAGAAESEAVGRARSTPADGDARPRIKVVRGQIHVAVDASVAAIAADPAIYQRDGELVRVVRVAEAEAKHEHMAPGTAQIRPVPTATLRERLSRLARFERYDGRAKAWVAADPNDAIVAAVAVRHNWPSVRVLTGVIETPILRPDGSVLDAPGYDTATGYVYAPRTAYPELRPYPTIAHARAALAALVEPWAEFPCAESARYVPVSALLSLLARPAIHGAVPIHAMDASVHGSGKTLMARGIGILAHGREPALMTWPPDDVETEKVLGAYALRGTSLIVFDNVDPGQTFGGASLDKVASAADRVELRILGLSQLADVRWRALILATGNNLAIARDTTRRVLMCRLEPQVERPEERVGWAIPDLAAWCHAQHPILVAAGLTLLRAYMLAGRPAMPLTPFGSYEAWSDLVPSAIRWAGGPDLSATRPTVAGADDEQTSALRVVLQHWSRLSAEYPDGMTVASAVATLWPESARGVGRPRDAYEELREALLTLAPPRRPGDPPDTKRLGIAFRGQRGRVIGGHGLDVAASKAHGGALKWRVCHMEGER